MNNNWVFFSAHKNLLITFNHNFDAFVREHTAIQIVQNIQILHCFVEDECSNHDGQCVCGHAIFRNVCYSAIRKTTFQNICRGRLCFLCLLGDVHYQVFQCVLIYFGQHLI